MELGLSVILAMVSLITVHHPLQGNLLRSLNGDVWPFGPKVVPQIFERWSSNRVIEGN